MPRAPIDSQAPSGDGRSLGGASFSLALSHPQALLHLLHCCTSRLGTRPCSPPRIRPRRRPTNKPRPRPPRSTPTPTRPARAARTASCARATCAGNARCVEPPLATRRTLLRPLERAPLADLTSLSRPLLCRARCASAFSNRCPLSDRPPLADSTRSFSLSDPVRRDWWSDWARGGHRRDAMHAVRLARHSLRLLGTSCRPIYSTAHPPPAPSARPPARPGRRPDRPLRGGS